MRNNTNFFKLRNKYQMNSLRPTSTQLRHAINSKHRINFSSLSDITIPIPDKLSNLETIGHSRIYSDNDIVSFKSILKRQKDPSQTSTTTISNLNTINTTINYLTTINPHSSISNTSIAIPTEKKVTFKLVSNSNKPYAKIKKIESYKKFNLINSSKVNYENIQEETSCNCCRGF